MCLKMFELCLNFNALKFLLNFHPTVSMNHVYHKQETNKLINDVGCPATSINSNFPFKRVSFIFKDL